jgi:hypothetical protein
MRPVTPSNPLPEGFDDDFDPDEEDGGDECGRWDNGRLGRQCALAGTEHCDFDCPLRDEL